MWALWPSDPACGDLAMFMRIYVQRASAYGMSDLLYRAKDCPVPALHDYAEIDMKPKITERDIRLLELVASSGWLATHQIQYALFPNATRKVVNKRMRKLVAEGCLHAVRLHRTAENLYRLGSKGMTLLRSETNFPEDKVIIQRKPPRELDHVVAINDLRVIFEREVQMRGGEMKFFLTDIELRKRNEKASLIPDALTHFILDGKDYRFAIEYDNGTETPQYFAREKVRKYIQMHDAEKPLFSLTDFRVVVVAESFKGATKLMKAAIKEDPPAGLFYFGAIETFDPETFVSHIFLDPVEVIEQQEAGSENQWHGIFDLASQRGASRRHTDHDNPLKEGYLASSTSPTFTYEEEAS